MAYGVLPEGFASKPLTAIQASIVERLQASSAVGPAQDYSSQAPLGQIVGAIASEIAELWELGFAVHTSGDPEGALGVPLDQILSLNGTERLEARASTAVCTLNLDAGATVPAGSLISVDGRPDIQFELDAEVTNSGMSADDFPGDFTCTVLGPVAVNADTLTVIDTPITGWNTVTNDEDAVLGRNVATDIEFRQRWADEHARQGSTTVSAIRAALLDTELHPELATIEKVLVLENKEDTTDTNGLPPHSVEAIIDDGASPSVDDDLIAQIIWDKGAAGGIDTHGNQSGTATDSEGVEHEILFSRVTRIDIYIAVTVSVSSSYPTSGADLVKAALVTAGNGYQVSEDVIALFIRSKAFNVAGVVDVPDFSIGLTGGPSTDDNIAINYRERATFDTSRVSVTEEDA